MKKIVVLLFIASFAMGMAAHNVDMRLRLEVGKEYYMAQNVNTVMNQQVMGSMTSMATDNKTTTSWLVKSFSGGVYEFGVRYRHISSEVNSDYGNTLASSDNAGEGDITSSLLGAITGTEFTVRMDDKGKVLEVAGFDKVMQNVAVQFPDSDTMLNSLKEMYSAETFKANVETTMSYLPSKEVAVGGGWQTENIMSSMGLDINNKTAYTYVGIENGNVIIRGRSQLATEPGSTMVSGGMTMNVNLSGTMDQDIKADRNTLWVSESVMKQDMGGDFSVFVPSQGEVKIGIDMETEIITTDSE